MLLNDDEDLISQHFNMDTEEELFAMVGPLFTRQHHSRPLLYSEQWIDRYVDEDFKMNFRLTCQQFEVVLTAIERFKSLQYAIKSCLRKYSRLGPMTLLLYVLKCKCLPTADAISKCKRFFVTVQPV